MDREYPGSGAHWFPAHVKYLDRACRQGPWRHEEKHGRLWMTGEDGHEDMVELIGYTTHSLTPEEVLAIAEMRNGLAWLMDLCLWQRHQMEHMLYRYNDKMTTEELRHIIDHVYKQLQVGPPASKWQDVEHGS